MKWKFDPEQFAKLPKYKQIIAAVKNDIEKGVLSRNDQLPSINEMSFEYDLARDTVEKAYRELKEDGIIGSIRGKGFYVEGIKNPRLRVLLILNKISAYKKITYYAFIHALGDKASVDIQVHHYSLSILSQILDDNLGKYHYYVIMPHFFEGFDKTTVVEQLQRIPEGELVLLDKRVADFNAPHLCVYQDFENDIYDALEGELSLLKKYERIVFVFPTDEYYAPDILSGFKKFCSHFDLQATVVSDLENEALIRHSLYIVIEEIDLVDVVKKCRDAQLEIGTDIGIISFNETPLKEVLAGGITTLSTQFSSMGVVAASCLLNRQFISIRNPFSIIIRSST